MKRIFSVCAAAVLLCTNFSAGATLGCTGIFASADDSGSCGESATWQLKDGVLTVSGTGEMTSAPWRSKSDMKQAVRKVVIKKGIETICKSAFEGCKNITNISIPNTVVTIGASAFNGCSALSSITVPESVTKIGSSAFYNCSGLKDVILPYDLTVIENYTFYGCSSLSSVELPPSMAEIRNYAFSHCTALSTVDLTGSLKKIGEAAFSESGLTSVTVPGNITSVGNHAFDGCKLLRYAMIEPGIQRVPEAIFKNCIALEAVSIPETVTSVIYAFEGCSTLKSIEFPQSVATLYNPLENCASLQEVYIYNPNCKITDGLGSVSLQIPLKATVFGYDNSTAQTYAQQNALSFNSLGTAPVIEKPAGDLNSDNRVTVQDAILLARIITEDKTLQTTQGMIMAADVNKDGQIDIDDTVFLLKKIAGTQ